MAVCAQAFRWKELLATAFAAPSARRIVLVTGGSRGIGRSVCEQLLGLASEEQPMTVIVSGRNAASVEAAAQELSAGLPPGAEVRGFELDVSAKESRSAAVKGLRELLGSEAALSVLVNNAGVAMDLPWSPPPPPGGDAEIAERTVGTNFVGAVELTRTLKEAGLLSQGSRVIQVSSGGGHIAMQKIKPEVRATFLAPDISTNDILGLAENFVADAQKGGKDELMRQWGYNHCYGFSKLCMTTSCRTLAREFPDLIVHGATPGFIKTGMTEGSSATGTPEEGARVIVWLALSDEPRVLESGKFFNAKREELGWDEEYNSSVSKIGA